MAAPSGLIELGLALAVIGSPEERCRRWRSAPHVRSLRSEDRTGKNQRILANAAIAIDAMHRGRKRLVFVDSRRGAEELGARLVDRGATTFVTHGSLLSCGCEARSRAAVRLSGAPRSAYHSKIRDVAAAQPNALLRRA